ncbi:hypothetical protein SAMN04488540_11715 [Ferrimonas sediminum]|uniref:Helicase HerA central domain-containing protein n=1 Tax=Ferrimonas sediminum TaxID=718193 RepID=A0A1G8YAF3_9GAMM|nr:ATP-binding protein [Ferrimonas sediminum]SDJ99663.1 hypothetical protein SAMN04488540_11715 [Ferrimonas sediminum]
MESKSKETYLGSVISVSGVSVSIELTQNVRSGLLIIDGRTHRIGLVGSFIRIPQGYNDLYGIISETSETMRDDNLIDFKERRLIKVELVGESVGTDFERGISQFPSIGDEAHLVTENDLKKVYGTIESGQVDIGRLSSSESIRVGVDLNNLVNRHSAILGSTGSGKSTSVSSLLRSLVEGSDGSIEKKSARIIIFDIHGEYSSALGDIANVFTTGSSEVEKQLYIPFWCVNPDSLIDFLCGANERLKGKARELILEDKVSFAIKNPELGIEKDKVTAYSPLPYRIKNVWFKLYCEDNITWEDNGRTTPAIESEGDPNNLIVPRYRPPGAGSSPPFKGGKGDYSKSLEQMRSRLLDKQYSFLFEPGLLTPNENNEIKNDLSWLLESWIGTVKPVTIIDMSGMPSERLSLLLGSLLDMVFEAAIWGRNLPDGMKESPVLLVMEEAHRYLSNDKSGLAKEMVKRIVKEGRKFGVGCMLVSQRPSEIDETILSQCGTLFSLRINNATDRSKVKSSMSDGLSGLVDALPILRTGEAVVAGEAVKIPMRCKFKLPKQGRFPDSKDPMVAESWIKNKGKSDFSDLIRAWRIQSPINNEEK